MRHESPFLGRFTIDSACALYLRLKASGTADVLTIAGDEPFLGEAELIAYASGDPMTLYTRDAPGTHTYVANGAIAKWATVSTAAAGKVTSGSGGAMILGLAMTETTVDNERIEVLPLVSLSTLTRAMLTQQDLVRYPIDFTLLRVWDARQTNLPGTAAADDAALVTGTFGTNAPRIQGVDFGGTTTDEKFAFTFVLPAEYVAGETVTLRAKGAMLTTISDGTATIDFQVHKRDLNGAVGADICADAAKSINSLTPANKDFTITPTGLAPGDVLEIRGEFIGSDTGNVGVMIPEISDLAFLLDIKG